MRKPAAIAINATRTIVLSVTRRSGLTGEMAREETVWSSIAESFAGKGLYQIDEKQAAKTANQHQACDRTGADIIELR